MRGAHNLFKYISQYFDVSWSVQIETDEMSGADITNRRYAIF
jgi:hypothetical protein